MGKLGQGLTLVLTSFLANLALATSFVPVPLTKMLVPANAIVVGDFLESRSVQLEDGTIATEAHFKIESEWGINAEEYGITEIKVFYPGGTLMSVTAKVDGAPSFVSGEKNVLLLNQNEDGRLWVQGLSMGTFKLVRVGHETMLINPVFPDHPELSQLTLEQFGRKVAEAKSSGLKAVQTDKYILEMDKEHTRMVSSSAPATGRSIASVAHPHSHEANTLDSFWLIAILSTMGVLVTWRARRKAK